MFGATLLLGFAGCGTQALRPGERPAADQGIAYFRIQVVGRRGLRLNFVALEKSRSLAGHIDAHKGDGLYLLPLKPGKYRLESVASMGAGRPRQAECLRPFEVVLGASSYGGTIVIDPTPIGTILIGCASDQRDYEEARRAYERVFRYMAREVPSLNGMR